MSEFTFQTVPPPLTQSQFNAERQEIADRLNGITLDGVRSYPYSYLLRKNGAVYEAIDYAANLAFGGSDDAGGVDGEDAAAVIQATLANNTHLYFRGVFDITSASLDINGLTNLRIEGAGMGSAILRQTGTVSGQLSELIKVRGASSNIIMDYFMLKGVGDASHMEQGKQGIAITEGSSDIFLNRLGFETIDGAIVRITPTGYGPPITGQCERIFMSELINTDGLTAGGVTFDGAVDSVLHHSFIDTWDAPITSARVQNVKIHHNTLISETTAAVIDNLVQTSDDIFTDYYIEDNTLISNAGTGSGIRLAASPGSGAVYVRRWHLNRNKMNTCNYGIVLSCDAYTGMSEIEIKDNLLSECAQRAIYIQPGDYSTRGLQITGNTILDGQLDAIYVTRTGVGLTYDADISHNIIARNGQAETTQNAIDLNYVYQTNIIGNLIYDNQGSPTQIGGIYLNYGDQISVKDNIIKNTTTYINIAGTITNLVIKDNPGYNPVGIIASPYPGVTGDLTNSSSAQYYPASTAVYTVKQTPKTIIVGGGTISEIAINGLATGLTSGVFRLDIDETIKVTHSVLPTINQVRAE